MPEQCPAHRAGLNVTVTERHDRTLRCTRTPICNLQAGHPGKCDEPHTHVTMRTHKGDAKCVLCLEVVPAPTEAVGA